MTAKEYLKQSYRLKERIDAHIAELEELRDMSTKIQSINFDERVSSTKNTDASFTKLICKIADMEARINSDVERLVDLKAEMNMAINEVDDIEEQLLLNYRYINNISWDDIATKLNVSNRTVHRIHSAALQNFIVPEKCWHALS